MSKTNPDFAARIAQFHRRSNVEWITLVLHTTKEQLNTSQTSLLGRKPFLFNLSPFFRFSADANVIQPTTSVNDEKPYQIIFGYPNKPSSVRNLLSFTYFQYSSSKLLDR